MSPDQYRDKAEEAEKLASDPLLNAQQRKDYLDMASSWRACADQATNLLRCPVARGGKG